MKMKIVISNKKQTALSLILVLTILVGAVFSANSFAKERLLPIYSVKTDKKVVALSFDAAWGNDDTETLINILAKYNAPATFFVVGDWVDKYPESVKQLADAGHQIQNHSNKHPYMTKLSDSAKIEELKTCNEKIAAVAGQTPTLFRCPYGDYDNSVITATESIGMFTIQWDVDSLDWKENATPDSIFERVTSKVKNGSIVLFHNDADHTPAALPRILEKLKNDGYEFVFINDLIYKENYQIIHDGTQVLKKDG